MIEKYVENNLRWHVITHQFIEVFMRHGP